MNKLVVLVTKIQNTDQDRVNKKYAAFVIKYTDLEMFGGRPGKAVYQGVYWESLR